MATNLRGGVLRARAGITWPFGPPIHPAWLRCSSVTDEEYAPSSRLASRAPERPRWPPTCGAGYLGRSRGPISRTGAPFGDGLRAGGVEVKLDRRPVRLTSPPGAVRPIEPR